jgi:thiol-disulfide isomerase/thioredoxin
LATIANGVERIPVACQRFGSRLLLDFPVYGRRISADESADGELAGHWEQTGGASARQRLPFGASPLDNLDPTRRFAVSDRSMVKRATGPGAHEVSGVWRMEFGVLGTARGTFEQEPSGVVRGTIEVPAEYGDLRFLAGTVDGATLSLSTFDGGHGYLAQAHFDDDGSMQGDVLGTDGVRHGFSAARSEEFEPVDPLQQVIVRSQAKRLDFAPLLSSRYAGKAVILELFGTWCANCNDLAPLLTELYRDHREAGLAIIGLAFEVSDDEAFNRDRIAAYRGKHGFDWEVIFADRSPDETLSVGPAKLSPINGVPVTIFLNRDRTIQAIYTGFRGPATGAAHLATVATFRRLTREILNSTGDAVR